MQKEDNLNEYFTNLTHKSEKICYTTIRNKIFLKLIRKKGCPVDGSVYERAAKLGPVRRAAGMDCECPFYMRRFGGTGNQTGGTYMENNLIIAIGRQFGSGGHEIGEKLAKKLGIKFYDKELIKLIAKESGLCEKVLESYDEKPTNSTVAFTPTITAASLPSITGAIKMCIRDRLKSLRWIKSISSSI